MIDTDKVDINKAAVLAELQLHNGRDQGIHIRDLVAKITNSLLGGEAEERKVRKLIEELRREHHPICAHPDSGYYIAANAKELNETCAFLLARADTTVAQVAAMKNREAPDLYDALGVGRPKEKVEN
ncbi:MAG: hypothetical protein HYX47_10400 [Burkholderiales bacterium]|nr:hypothetical protein [Burkholderiales bacterium]